MSKLSPCLARRTSGRWIRVLCLALPLASGCQLFPARQRVNLQPGLRVEVEGDLDDPRTARDIEEKPADASVEIRAPLVVSGGAAPFEILGVPLHVVDRTEVENQEREEIAADALVDGEWVQARAALATDRLEARKIRQQPPRPRWEVEGTIVRVDEGEKPGHAWISIPPFEFEVTPRTKIQRNDPDSVWEEFLRSGPLARRASNEQKFVPFSIPVGEDVRLGGQVSTEVRQRENFDLDDDRNRDELDLAVGGKLAMIARLHGEAFFLAELSGEVALTDRKGSGRTNEKSLTIRPNEVYLFQPDLGIEGLHVQAGRQDFDESREWLYDETLDALRVYYEVTDEVQLEASVSQTPRLLSERHLRQVVRNLIALLSWRIAEDWVLSAYVIDRRSRPFRDFSPVHSGVRSYGEIVPGVHHWLELARVDGVIDDRRMQGHAVDVGVTWVADLPFEPSATLGYAYGSGDRRATEVDHTFRQTGLQDNNEKWNGVTSFRYYGEVMDPELSNLQIITAGWGVRPTERTAVDLVGHGYRQVEAVAGATRSDLRTQATGTIRGLGKELDLIVGMRERFVTVELVGGMFWPGAGLVGNDRAYLLAGQLRFKF